MIKIIIGYLLDLIIGDPQNPYHPIRGIGKIAQIFENLFRKIFKKHLKLAGAITWIVVVSIVFLINFLLIKLLGKINPYIETNIYKSSKNVNLDALIEYKKDGKRCNFLDRY